MYDLLVSIEEEKQQVHFSRGFSETPGELVATLEVEAERLLPIMDNYVFADDICAYWSEKNREYLTMDVKEQSEYDLFLSLFLKKMFSKEPQVTSLLFAYGNYRFHLAQGKDCPQEETYTDSSLEHATN